MNYWISILFRAIPLAMGAASAALGVSTLGLSATDDSYVAGNVLIALAAICAALYATAATIIQQLIGKFDRFWMITNASVGYGAAAIAIIWGFIHTFYRSDPGIFVAGHVVFGIGLVAACVSTVCISSTKFKLIPKNASDRSSDATPAEAYSKRFAAGLTLIPLICFAIGCGWGIRLLGNSADAPYFVAGNVLTGLGTICGCLFALVFTITAQTRNSFSNTTRWVWTFIVVTLGTLVILRGFYVLIFETGGYRIAPGFVLIGLGAICYSISSKVLLLALTWKRTSGLSNRVPLIPIMTCLFCLFLAAFLGNIAVTNGDFFVPSRVLVGLGAVCFTLFSIVSILEAGTSEK